MATNNRMSAKKKISIFSMQILPRCSGRWLSTRVLTPGLRNKRKTALGLLLLTRTSAPRTTCAAHAAVSVFQAYWNKEI